MLFFACILSCFDNLLPSLSVMC